MINLFACNHDWSFPIKLRKRRYPMPYDSHQCCLRCGAERLYAFASVEAGPEIDIHASKAGEDISGEHQMVLDTAS